MAAPSREALERLHEALTESLVRLFADHATAAEPDRAPPPAPYVVAAIRFLKENGVRVAAPPAADAEAAVPLDQLPSFEDEPDEDD